MDIKSKLENMTKEGFFPGATYGIVYQGKKYFDSVGYRSLEPTIERNNLDTVYDIASLTKVIVTTTLISKLQEQNKLHFHDSVCSYLKEFPYPNITIYHLLTHTSGLHFSYQKKISSLEDVYRRMQSLYPVRKPGTLVEYADHHFILLGWIMESIYQDTLDHIAQKEIFEPLKMHHTSYGPVDFKACAPTEWTKDRGLLRGVVHDEKAYHFNRSLGNSGVFSTALDLTKFAQMVLQNGVYDHKRFLKKETIDCWFQPLEQDAEKNTRGIGWLVGNVASITGTSCSKDSICHTGFTGTTMIIDRGNELGFVFLSNRIHPTRENKKLLSGRREITETVYTEFSKLKTKLKK